MFSVRDRNRILEFDGQLLGASSSRVSDSARWVEFAIYRTNGHEYVLSRVGHSAVYHSIDCDLLQTDAIPPVSQPHRDSIPCPHCSPDAQGEAPVRPETQRYFARVYQHPEHLIADLYRSGADGSRYLTRVARSVLLEAARVDPRMRLSA